eukprot:672888-Prorocentrum_minimum.AAC.1
MSIRSPASDGPRVRFGPLLIGQRYRLRRSVPEFATRSYFTNHNQITIKSNQKQIKSFEKCTRSRRPTKRNPNRTQGPSEAAWDFDFASRGKMTILARIYRKDSFSLLTP